MPGGIGQLHYMLAESVNHYYVSDLLPDFCGVIVERDRRIVQSDLSGLWHLTFIRCCFLCILHAAGGCFGTGNMTEIRTGAAMRGGGGAVGA